MDNEYILRWISEFGMGEVRPTDVGKTDWGEEFDWTKASDDGYLEREADFKRFRIRYSLTQKALDKLKEN
jgi:hypothetical protein